MGLFDKLVDSLKSWESPKTESQIEATKEDMSQVEWEEDAKPSPMQLAPIGSAFGCIAIIVLVILSPLIVLYMGWWLSLIHI